MCLDGREHLPDVPRSGGPRLGREQPRGGLRARLSESERAILLDGGLLNHLRQGDASGWDAEHADEDHDHAHVLRGEQGYGGHHG